MVRRARLGLASTGMAGDSTFLVSASATTTASRVPPLDAIALGDLFDRLEDLVAQSTRTHRGTARMPTASTG